MKLLTHRAALLVPRTLSWVSCLRESLEIKWLLRMIALGHGQGGYSPSLEPVVGS